MTQPKLTSLLDAVNTVPSLRTANCVIFGLKGFVCSTLNLTFVFVSVDAGATWARSDLIDLDGNGHHDGAIEATLAELSAGRLLMLIRTSLDQFWEAYSDDNGYHWRRDATECG